MSRPKVYVPNAIPEEAYRILAEHCDIRYRDTEDPVPDDEVLAGVRDADGLVIYSRVKVNQAVLDAAPRLRVVSNIAVGYDNLDIPALTRRGVVATNTPGVLTETTADLAFALLMAIARRVVEADRYVKSGQWDGWRPSLMVGRDVYGATIGIVGMGRIGQAVARRARGFDMRILYHNRSRNPQAEAALGAEYKPLDDLLREADFVVLLTPLTPETTRLIGARELALMKPDAYLINAARGAVVDEAALIEALREGRIAGAALDVYEQEPVALDNPLLQMDNVVTLPHIGSATKATRIAMAVTAARNMVAALAGEVPPNAVNPEAIRPKAQD
ncbi:2-hydroxyacid dehydrogenase [Alicyclobacillus macrosporangiidus]|uniref:2-hydroxyacid dehydrogenase n=1 Tax=Alicyclobacillus macrosporangiidus TaxID=392015 RepID=UPI0004985021|nr:D-glycerate dehydrogenase [Alicyclobacillus macrosporangiidus]